MFMTVLLFAYVWGFCYNEFLILGGPQYIPYKVSKNMGIKNETFMKVAAMGTWFGDFITAWMVTDMMLQVRQSCVSLCRKRFKSVFVCLGYLC